MSRRSYAAQRGVSEAAVRKAIATGTITALPKGTINPWQTNSEWWRRPIRPSSGPKTYHSNTRETPKVSDGTIHLFGLDFAALTETGPLISSV